MNQPWVARRELPWVIGAHMHWLKSEPAEGMERFYGEEARTFFWRSQDGDLP